jgi:hypothetical protein
MSILTELRIICEAVKAHDIFGLLKIVFNNDQQFSYF